MCVYYALQHVVRATFAVLLKETVCRLNNAAMGRVIVRTVPTSWTATPRRHCHIPVSQHH